MQDDEQSFRQYLAANDPSFPARREEAHGLIVAALAEVLVPEGFVQKGTTFSKASPQGKAAVHLQRNRYGWEAQIVLRFLTPEGEVPVHPDWPGGEDVTLAQFFETTDSDPGTLVFLDVLADRGHLDQAVGILREQVLPWFDALHQEGPPRT